MTVCDTARVYSIDARSGGSATVRFRTIACFGVLVALASAAHASPPGGALLGRPVVGVHPGAPAAIAPSFRSPVPRTRVPVVRSAPWAAVPVFVGPPVYYDPAYVVPPVALVPAVESSAPPPAPAAPPPPPERDVVHYADGRYELRGDGIATPHRWVWVPNPPPPPAPSSGREVRLYGWVDENGVVNVTDRLDRVPERHRAQAKRNASS
jgi:hypothetical protein